MSDELIEDLIAKMLQATDGVAPNLFNDICVVRAALRDKNARIEKLEDVHDQADLYLYCSRTYGVGSQEGVNSGNQLADALKALNEQPSGEPQ